MSLSPADSAPSLLYNPSPKNLPSRFPAESEPLAPTISSRLSLAQAVEARRAEYTTPKTARVKVGTWNVAAFKDTEKDIDEWFVRGQGVSRALPEMSLSSAVDTVHQGVPPRGEVLSKTQSVGGQQTRHSSKEPKNPEGDLRTRPSDRDVDIYALGLQEIVDINSAVEALRPFSDASASKRFKAALEKSLPPHYQLVAEQQLIGLLLLVYAAPNIAPQIRSVATTSVGTGLMGYMGNKGAVTARIVLGATTRLIFINSHMSSGVGKTELDRRNWDAAQIASRIRFDSVSDDAGIVHEQGEKIDDADYAFWFGDLNYRLEGVPADDVRRILKLHIDNEYNPRQHPEQSMEAKLAPGISTSSSTYDLKDMDVSSAETVAVSPVPLRSIAEPRETSEDPTSFQATISSLLAHDELHQQQTARKAFHDGWREEPIIFLPTYKYDVGTVDRFDSGEKKRGPSWCDRILYRTRKDRLLYEDKVRIDQEAKARDDQMRAQGIEKAAQDERTMFEYDPNVDGDDYYEDRSVNSDYSSAANPQETVEDTIRVEFYCSHQNIVSSDHKPLACSFVLTYDAVDMELKSRIHEKVAREIDRAENEGRPMVTMLVDGGSRGGDPDFNGIDFGPIRYDDPMTRFITIANTGQGSAQFGFIDPQQQANNASLGNVAPRWLSLNFRYQSDSVNLEYETIVSREEKEKLTWAHGISRIFTLDPGDTMTVDLVCHIKDKTLVEAFNDGDRLDVVLILRVKDGRDYFLPVKASWQSSIHGRTIDRLIRIPEGGIRALQAQKPHVSLGDERSEEPPVIWSAPREIFRLTEAIESLVERISAEWSMLGVTADGIAKHPLVAFAGWPFVEESWTLDAETRRALRVDINEALDTDQSFDSMLSSELPLLHRVEVFAEALLDFLGNLKDGVIPPWLWEILQTKFFAKGKANLKLTVDEKRPAILEILASSPSHSISFVLLTSMLARVSQEVWSSVQSVQALSGTIAQLPESPRFKVKGKILGPDYPMSFKKLIQKNLAGAFADVLVPAPEKPIKRQNGNFDYRGELLEIFLESSA